MIAPTAHCDAPGCGRAKGAGNHWFQVRLGSADVRIEKFDSASRHVKHVCGEVCLQRVVSAAIAGLGATARPAPDEAPIEFPILTPP